MKMTQFDKIQTFPNAGTLNIFSLGAISLTWGHMLDLVPLWLLPLTVLLYVIGYGSEVKPYTK